VDHHLAQFNVARLHAPIDDPSIAEFVEALEPINALADTAPGFVWRLQTDDGDATSIRLFDDDLIIVNMSVWESVESLRAFVYTTEHRRYLARRKEWFGPMDEDYLVLWWVQSGTTPDPTEGVARLERLRTHGPTPEAFTFRQAFPPPEDATRPDRSARAP
jgi:hypothetical protein